MKSPTGILSAEHSHILKVVHALVKECDAIGAGKKLDKEFFEKAIDFIRNYADKFHHAKEENILFVELCKPTTQMHCNPTEQMLHEHELGRKFVKGLDEALRKGNKEKIIENAAGYAQLLQEHIYKEDNILYPMADSALGAKVQKEILERFKKADSKFNGADKKYISLAGNFERRK